MQECDVRSKAKRKDLKSSVEKENIKIIGPCTQVLNECLKEKKHTNVDSRNR